MSPERNWHLKKKSSIYFRPLPFHRLLCRYRCYFLGSPHGVPSSSMDRGSWFFPSGGDDCEAHISSEHNGLPISELLGEGWLFLIARITVDWMGAGYKMKCVQCRSDPFSSRPTGHVPTNEIVL